MRISDWSSDVCSSDLVPRPDAYFDPINWHRTAFHELSHWVGGRSRLDRDQTGAFGSKEYGREELIAEMGGARSEEHTSELQSLMRISYAVFCLTKKKHTNRNIKQQPNANKPRDIIQTHNRPQSLNI